VDEINQSTFAFSVFHYFSFLLSAVYDPTAMILLMSVAVPSLFHVTWRLSCFQIAMLLGSRC